MDIQYVFGAHDKFSNRLWIAVKIYGEDLVRTSLFVNGIDGHCRMSHKEAKDMFFDLVYTQDWECITEDDVFDICHVRKRPLYTKISTCNRFARCMVPVMILGLVVVCYSLFKKL